MTGNSRGLYTLTVPLRQAENRETSEAYNKKKTFNHLLGCRVKFSRKNGAKYKTRRCLHAAGRLYRAAEGRDASVQCFRGFVQGVVEPRQVTIGGTLLTRPPLPLLPLVCSSHA